MESQPEYKAEADTFKVKGETKSRQYLSTQQAAMITEFQKSVGTRPTEFVAEKIRMNDDYSFGFNADILEYVNMLEAGIIDPTKVVRSALENAASAAATFITTECVVSEKPEEKKGGTCPMPSGGMSEMGY